MKRLEKILGIIIVIGLVLKLTLVPGGSLLLVISITTLGCLYYFSGFALFNEIKLRAIFKKESYNGIKAIRILGTVGLGMALSVICIGVLFKLQNYPGANINLLTGLASTLIVLVIALFRFAKSKDIFYKRILKRIAIIGSVGVFFLSISDLSITKFMFRNHPEYIKAYEECIKNPENQELRKKEDIEYHRATMSKEDFEFYMRVQYKQ